MKKPNWVIEKEQSKKAAKQETVWLFGLHAVRDALLNDRRTRLRLIVTKNAADKLASAIEASGMQPEISDPRKFSAPLDPGSVHQGAALEVKPLNWGTLEDVALASGQAAPRLVLLDQVTDPHNVGAILRSAEVFGANAVIGTRATVRPKPEHWQKPQVVHWNGNPIFGCVIWPIPSSNYNRWAILFWDWTARQKHPLKPL